MKVRHKNRGTEYEVIRTGVMQDSTTMLYDNKSVVIYQSIDGGQWYVREYHEFFDGRFEIVG